MEIDWILGYSISLLQLQIFYCTDNTEEILKMARM
jgi:hypothetical protein